MAVIHGLKPKTTYRFQVAGVSTSTLTVLGSPCSQFMSIPALFKVNTAGVGEWSDTTTFETPGLEQARYSPRKNSPPVETREVNLIPRSYIAARIQSLTLSLSLSVLLNRTLMGSLVNQNGSDVIPLLENSAPSTVQSPSEGSNRGAFQSRQCGRRLALNAIQQAFQSRQCGRRLALNAIQQVRLWWLQARLNRERGM